MPEFVKYGLDVVLEVRYDLAFAYYDQIGKQHKFLQKIGATNPYNGFLAQTAD